MSNTDIPFIAKRDLTEEEFIIFSNQYINSYKSAQKRIREARATRDRMNEWIASSLIEINSIKQTAMKHGVELP